MYPRVDGNSKNLPREPPSEISPLHSRRPSVLGYTIPPYRIPPPASQGSAVCNRYIRVISDNLSAYKQALLVYYPQSSTKVDKAKFTRSPTLALRSSHPFGANDSRPRSLAPRAAWIVTVHLRLSVLRYPSRAAHAPHAQSLRLSFTAPNHSVASTACGSRTLRPAHGSHNHMPQSVLNGC